MTDFSYSVNLDKRDFYFTQPDMLRPYSGGYDMGKVLQNKLQKRTALLNSAYELFTSKGFTKTTIRDIAENAGVAKGTFYLYFRDKTDIRDALIRAQTSRLLQEACESMDRAERELEGGMDITDKFIYAVDFIVDTVSKDRFFLKFISKHLSWGLFSKGPRTPQEYYGIEEDGEPPLDIEVFFREMLDADGIKIHDLRVLLFTLLELISSMTYDLVLYEEPMSLEEFKPHLHRIIRLLVEDAIVTD